MSHPQQTARYYGFRKQVLWPAFHNIDLLDLSTCGWLSDPNSIASDWDQSRLDDWWHSYVALNQSFPLNDRNVAIW
jgi:trehalose 6-phosphate synthase/phosphatase